MSSSIRPLVQKTYEQISDDTKLVRLTTVTKLIHSAVFLFFMGSNIYSVVIKAIEWKIVASGSTDVFLWVLDAFPLQDYWGWMVLIAILLVIWYYLFPPVWQASLIYYLDDENKKWGESIAKWLGKFFPMLEYNWMTSMFTPLFFIIIASRFWIMDILNNWFVLSVVIIWLLLVCFVSLFFSFSHYYIVLEWAKPVEAISKSMQLSLKNLGKVIKANILQVLLGLNFIINICLFFGIPFLIFYARLQFWGELTWTLWGVVIGIAAILWLLLAYVNGIIESFFTTLRYHLFKQIK